jgi:serine/threonine protein kinase
MTPEDYRQAGELFDRVSDLPEGERKAVLETASPALRDQVQTLLAADSEAGLFLEGCAIEDAARLLRHGPLPPGTRFGPYEIVERIGAGGMGEVYRAWDRKLDRGVAIKVLGAAFAGDAQFMARFEREAQVLASLHHPNIAMIYGVEDSALIMELVEGPTLAERIAQEGRLPWEEAVEIGTQIAEALEAAHEKGVVHRDLKPANIKVTPDGRVKVLDFGLAKPQTKELSSGTSPGVILGTPAYMAPEQAKGKAVDRRADIWAFGVVLYEMLTGRNPFEREAVAETLAAVLR